MPPTTLAMRRPRQCLTRSMASCATCCASSRVGHRIRAPGVAALKLRGLVGFLRLRLGGASPRAAASSARRWCSARSCSSASACWRSSVCSTGSRKAAVLPLPVWLETIRSMKAACAVAAGVQRARDGLLLHGGGLGEAQVVDGGDQLGREAQRDEAVGQRRRGGGRRGASSTGVVSMSEEDCAGAKSPCTSKVSVMKFSRATAPVAGAPSSDG